MNEWSSTEVAALQASWLLSLRARNLATKTLRTYGDALAGLVAHSGASALDDLTRQAVRAYLADQGAQHKAATVSVRFRALQQFFKWVVEEGEAEVSPMQGLRAPVVPEEPVPVLSRHEVGALLDACSGSGFAARRDKGMLSLFLDTGMRLSELSGLQVLDLDLTQQSAIVPWQGAPTEGVLLRHTDSTGSDAVSPGPCTSYECSRSRALDWRADSGRSHS